MRLSDLFVDLYVPHGEPDHYESTKERITTLLDEALDSNETNTQLSKLGDVRKILEAYSKYESASQSAYPTDATGNPRTPTAQEQEAKRRAEQQLAKWLD